jgi:putative phage-type endonuclease
MSIVITAIESNEQWHALRKPVVGASEAGALVGEHPYITYWGLWAGKSGKLPPIEDNEAMERGRYLEPVAVKFIRDRNPDWEIIAPREHYADREFGIGATPDLLAHDPARGRGVIQIKSVQPSVFRQEWRGESDRLMVPTWIAIQALMEAYLTKSSWAAVAPFVVDYGIQCPVIDIPLHPPIIETLKTEAVEFWSRVIRAEEPEPDFRRDAALIRAALAREDGTEIDLSDDNELPMLLDHRDVVIAEAKKFDDERKAIDAALLHKLGNAAIGRFNGGYVSAKTVNRKAYEAAATSYRLLRVSRARDPDNGQRA